MQDAIRDSGKAITFSRNDYKILIELYNGQCFTIFNAFSLKTLQGKVGLSQNKVRQALKSFIEVGYVEEGATIQRAKTYYVTDTGIEKIQQIMK